MIETAAARKPVPVPGPSPRREPQDPVARAIRLALIAAALIPLVVYVWVALHRVGYRFELDWMEGGSVELAARVSAGHSLYVAPSLSYVGWTYTPLYYLLSAGVAQLTGPGFLPLRLVSIVASLLAMGTLGVIVARATADRVAGLLAAGLFAATYRLSGAWMDTGRVDSLALALTLLAVAAGARARRPRDGVVVGTLAFLAFFTKQSALIALAPALGVLTLRRPRAGGPALGLLGALVLASTLVLDARSGGWYRYYVLDELAHQPWSSGTWVGFWTRDLAPLWPVGLAAAGALWCRRRSRAPAWSHFGAYSGAAVIGLIASAWVSRLHSGGYNNVLMPAYAALALVGGLAYGGLPRSGSGARPRWVALPIVALQLGLLAFPIAAQIPTPTDRGAGAALLAALRALPGPVLVLRHPWYATETGRGTFAQEEAIGDVLRSSDPRGAQALRASLRHALNTLHVRAVVLDGSFDAPLLGPEFARDFRRAAGTITPRPLYPLTDVRTAPTLLYVRVRGGR